MDDTLGECLGFCVQLGVSRKKVSNIEKKERRNAAKTYFCMYMYGTNKNEVNLVDNIQDLKVYNCPFSMLGYSALLA